MTASKKEMSTKEFVNGMAEQRMADLLTFLGCCQEVNAILTRHHRQYGLSAEDHETWARWAQALGNVIGNEEAVARALGWELQRRVPQANDELRQDIWNRFYGIGRPEQTTGQIAADLDMTENAVHQCLKRLREAGWKAPFDKRKSKKRDPK